MENRLVEINQKDLKNLQNLYETNLTSYIGYLTIENYIRWFENDPDLNDVKFYSLNGNFSDGTFVVIDRDRAYADTLNESYENLYHLLQLIDYSNGYTFLSIRPEVRATIRDALQRVGTEVICDEITLLFHLPKEEALKFDVNAPNGIELRSLMEYGDLEKINSLWQHRDPHSIQYFERLAKYNPNFGAFESGNNLVAWIFCLPTGIIGALETDERHRGHGYDSLVVRALSKKIAEMGYDIYMPLHEDNTSYASLFSSLGFEPVEEEVHWIVTKLNWSEVDQL